MNDIIARLQRVDLLHDATLNTDAVNEIRRLTLLLEQKEIEAVITSGKICEIESTCSIRKNLNYTTRRPSHTPYEGIERRKRT